MSYSQNMKRAFKSTTPPWTPALICANRKAVFESRAFVWVKTAK